MIGPGRASRPQRSRTWVLFLAVSLINGLLLWHFHDRYWYPTDDGLYAHLAERLLHGEVLNVDIQDIHPGYIHFLHAAAFRIFGTDMVSLRYPLMLAAFAQGCFVFALLQRRDVIFAALGSIAMTALGVLQFYDPTPNWYCLCLCVVLACWLVWLPRVHPLRLIGAGILVGVLTLLRQLSGVWVMMAVLVLALIENPTERRGGRVLLSRSLLVIMLAALIGYLVLSPETEPGGVLFMAIWPIGILAWMLINTRTTNPAVVVLLTQLAIGAAIPALPLVLYHIIHGSLGGWINDTVLAAFGETQMPFFGRGWYGVLPLAALYQAVSSLDGVKMLNGLYWTILPVVSAANGMLILKRMGRNSGAEELTLPVLAAFYALVSLYLEGPLYLYYTVGLSLIAVLWLIAPGSRAKQVLGAVTVTGLILVAVVFHAGQSRLRTPSEILQGVRVSRVWTSRGEGLVRCHLQLDQMDHDVYSRLVDVIERESQAGESIFAVPNDAELYFLAGRRNPFRFYNAALGVRTAAELRHVIDEMIAHPPRLVTFQPGDKYDTDASRHIMDLVRSRYDRIETIGGLEIYRLR